MCGIIGYVGSAPTRTPPLVGGLRKLEYRGYDSAGVSVFDRTTIDLAGRALSRQAVRARGEAAQGAGARNDRHRPHAMGDARPTVRREQPSAQGRADQRHSQRHHREPPRVARRARRRWRKVLVGDRYRDLRALGRAPDRGWRAGSHDRGAQGARESARQLRVRRDERQRAGHAGRGEEFVAARRRDRR